MKRTLHVGWPAIVMLALSIPAAGQVVSPGTDWGRGTTLNVFAGTAADSSNAKPLVGTSVGWEVTPRLAIEGSGYWIERGTGASSFAAALKLQTGLTAPHVAVPFLEAGVGLFRASFEPTATAVPDFYRRRMLGATAEVGATDTFTDPSFVVGGGINIFVTPHIAIRPDVETMIVRRDAQTYVVTAAAVHVAYHFESHPR
jgi:outer membrane protein with beta-barrel domain